MIDNDIKLIIDGMDKSMQLRQQFVALAKDCILPMDVIYDRALKEARMYADWYKDKLLKDIETFPLNKAKIIEEASDELRKEFKRDRINTEWLGDGIQQRESNIQSLSVYYGKTDDGLTIFHQIINTFDGRWKLEFLQELMSDTHQSGTVLLDTGKQPTLKCLSIERNQFCEGMEMEKPIRHFLPLTIPQKKNKAPFLSMEQFKLFMRKAFLKEENIDPIKLIIEKGDKYFIVKRFREFYDNYVEQYESTSHCIPKYTSLLTENFDNPVFENIASNFKQNRSKEKWKDITNDEWEKLKNS